MFYPFTPLQRGVGYPSEAARLSFQATGRSSSRRPPRPRGSPRLLPLVVALRFPLVVVFDDLAAGIFVLGKPVHIFVVVVLRGRNRLV